MSKPIIMCPHCQSYIEIEEINCAIFRHGVIKKTNTQINQHASKDECDTYIKNNTINGCGKPFRVISENNEYKAIICDYI